MWKPTNQPSTTPARPNEPERPVMHYPYDAPLRPRRTSSTASAPRGQLLPVLRIRQRSGSRW